VVRYREEGVQATPASTSPSSPFAIIAIPPQRPPVKFVREPDHSIAASRGGAPNSPWQ
jgi:hypothetical protein